MNAWLRAVERANTKDELVAQARDFCACATVARERAFDAEKVGDLLAYIDHAHARLGHISPHAKV